MTFEQPHNDETYSETIDKVLQAYNGEIYGIAFFEHFITHYPHPSNTQFWQKLIDIEMLTANILHKWLVSANVEFEINPESMQLKGQLEAKKWINLPWSELIETLLPWIAPYEHLYCEWEDSAQKDRQIFTVIAEHETALYHSWQREQRGENGIELLDAFINRYAKF